MLCLVVVSDGAACVDKAPLLCPCSAIGLRNPVEPCRIT